MPHHNKTLIKEHEGETNPEYHNDNKKLIRGHSFYVEIFCTPPNLRLSAWSLAFACLIATGLFLDLSLRPLFLGVS